ncbi:methionine biosynthesis protein MetW [Paraperlucidibaca baekdonensis]|uniref:Methionine biosynthesis protein MetW n=1 Tax=Paraperlucidibaca baekdonensis TaxID=748120 RepID=A0A3E0H909_9GAMM|nr:methionine biosynthesis protein MetW [Paraperlucidibaca baekdonensis]REH40196.1 methionine biosynthesis protein MetW [Paraperlucidibaca baekdonensis]
MRLDLALVRQWIRPESRVLDLGCGDGELLAHLRDTLNVRGYGLEIDHDKITAAIARGVNVIEQDLNNGLANIETDSFDTLLMAQALQAVQRPDILLDEMVRVAREVIITFPNFGHWKTRWYLLRKGRMPVSRALPYGWFDTPNIHLCTLHDFEALCRSKGLKVVDKLAVDQDQQGSVLARWFPNWFGEIGIFRVTRGDD